MLNGTQIKDYLRRLREGRSQRKAALAAGISSKAARKREDLPLPSEQSRKRSWCTPKVDTVNKI